jgi:hypothetical protein
LDESVEVPEVARELAAPARLQPQRYRVQFTASDEYVKLVEKVQALLSHSAERIPLDELQLRAMRTFVAELEGKKRARTTRTAAARARRSRQSRSRQSRSRQSRSRQSRSRQTRRLQQRSKHPRNRTIAERLREPGPNNRAGAEDRRPPRSGVPSSSAIRGAARSSTTRGSAAGKRIASSCTT